VFKRQVRLLHERNAHLVLIRIRRVNHVENLAFHLDHWLRESVQEHALHRTDLIIIVGMVFEVGGSEGKSAVERMLVMVRSGAVDFLVVGGIHVDLAGTCKKDIGLG